MGRVGVSGGRGGGGSNQFSKNLILSVSLRNFFLKCQGSSPMVKRDSVNLTLMHFCIENFHLGTLWFPGVNPLGGQGVNPDNFPVPMYDILIHGQARTPRDVGRGRQWSVGS